MKRAVKWKYKQIPSIQNMSNKTVQYISDSQILSWNIQGLRTGRPELKILTSQRDLLVMCLQETMCSNEKQTINGYKVYHRKRNSGNRSSGGVITAVKSEVDSQNIDIQTDLEAVAVKVGSPVNMSVLNIYLPPGRLFCTSEIVNLLK